MALVGGDGAGRDGPAARLFVKMYQSEYILVIVPRGILKIKLSSISHLSVEVLSPSVSPPLSLEHARYQIL